MVCSNNVIIIASDSEVLQTSKQGESPKSKQSGDVYIYRVDLICVQNLHF